MSRLLSLALASALCCTVPLSAYAAPPQAAWKAPRNAFGQPDLSGTWTNVSMTPESRPAELGARLAYAPDEVAKAEKAAAAMMEEGNKPTDPNAPVEAQPTANTRPEFAAAGGNVGGYNVGWLDPGMHFMTVNGEARTSILTTPNGRAPQPKAGVTLPNPFRDFNNFDNPETRSLGERCIMGFGRNAGPPMLANGFYNNNYQFVQTKDQVAIMVEMVHDVRLIRINGTHRTDGVRPWMGDSIGRWDGDTLVVETTNIPEKQAYRGAWKTLKVTERFRRVGSDRLYYQFTVEDPSVWDAAWGGEYEFNTLKGQIYEYACHEGNYALPGMLSGARQTEAAPSVKASGTGS